MDNSVFFMNECQKLEGKAGTVRIKETRKQKSNPENRYYRGVVVKRFAEYWGCSNEEAHRALGCEHLQVVTDNPEMPSYVRTTELSEWNTGEWEEYMAVGSR